MWFQKIFIPTPMEGLRFSRGEVNLPNFPEKRGGGCTIGKYFWWFLMALKRVTKKKTKNYLNNLLVKI